MPWKVLVQLSNPLEGKFANRWAEWLAEEASGTLFRSNGQYLNAYGEKSEEEGKTIGLVTFHHASGLNYPTYWHAQGYGCFATSSI